MGMVGLALAGSLASATLAQQTVLDRVEQRVDNLERGVKSSVHTINDALRKRFEAVRTEVHRMDTHSRLYSRLHWDRDLHGSKIEVHMLHGGVALLRGTVPTVEAKKKAVALATDTLEVKAVIDELTVSLSPEAVGAARPGSVR
jgi:osmotically-inducible protein OsmY